MPACSLHPAEDSAANCEVCGRPHCARCLRSREGRRCCPECARRLPRVAGGTSGLLYLTGFLLLIALLQLVTVVAVGALRGGASAGGFEFRLAHWIALFLLFGWILLFAVVAYTAAMARHLEGCSLAELGLRCRPGLWREALVALALATVLYVSIVGIGAGKGWYALHPRVSLTQGLLFALLGFVLLLPLAAVEEISLRGFLLRAASRSHGWPVAVVATAVVSAMLHGWGFGATREPLAALGLLLGGVYFALVRQMAGSLWFAIFLHAGWYTLEGAVFGFPVAGIRLPFSLLQTRAVGPLLWTGGSAGPESGLLFCGLLLVHLAALRSMWPWLERLLSPRNETDGPGPRACRHAEGARPEPGGTLLPAGQPEGG